MKRYTALAMLAVLASYAAHADAKPDLMYCVGNEIDDEKTGKKIEIEERLDSKRDHFRKEWKTTQGLTVKVSSAGNSLFLFMHEPVSKSVASAAASGTVSLAFGTKAHKVNLICDLMKDVPEGAENTIGKKSE